MEEHLISKKELLARYGISYGALYRWKRMGLIPEEWFQKKATETGQETFFNEEVICERIDRILAAKDLSSLTRLSEELSENKQADPGIVVETVYGRWRFRLEDIRKISIDEEIDITAETAEYIAKRRNEK